MGTAISKTAILGLAAMAMAASGCGTTGTAGPHRSSPSRPVAQARSLATSAAASTGFAWLRAEPTPPGWRIARIASGAVLRYPPRWRRVAGDSATATAVLQDAEHSFVGYLNLTPRQGGENLSTWAAFRTRHDTLEGDRRVTRLAAVTAVPFRHGHGSCVRDAYTTSTGNRFIELACLIQGSRATSVIVGAAPPEMWARISPTIERAISALPS
jgi:hypothetical protein